MCWRRIAWLAPAGLRIYLYKIHTHRFDIKVVKEKQVNYFSVTVCGTCCTETGRPRRMACGEYCMNTHSAKWPELCIPFEVGNPIYHEIILGNDYTPDGFVSE